MRYHESLLFHYYYKIYITIQYDKETLHNYEELWNSTRLVISVAASTSSHVRPVKSISSVSTTSWRLRTVGAPLLELQVSGHGLLGYSIMSHIQLWAQLGCVLAL